MGKKVRIKHHCAPYLALAIDIKFADLQGFIFIVILECLEPNKRTVVDNTMPEKIKIELDILLPALPGDCERCIERLRQFAETTRGVERAHLDRINGKTVMCIHYDDNCLTLAQIERLMRGTGADISERYKHDTFTIKGMHCAGCANRVERVLLEENGVIEANVNYAAEKLRVEYDAEQSTSKQILSRVKKLGYTVQTRASEDVDNSVARMMMLSIMAGLALTAGYLFEMFLPELPFVYLLMYMTAYLLGGYHATLQGIRAALQMQFDIDFLMVVAALGAAILGEYAEGALLLFLFSLGHALEHAAMDKARNAIRGLGKLSPETARIKKNGTEIECPINELKLGDIVIVRAGERLPVDGKILAGRSEVDQSPVTGESIPVAREKDDFVFAGTLNGAGALDIEVTRLASDTTLARVVKMVEEAQTKKSKSQRISQKFTSVFVPVILVFVVAFIFLPPFLGLLLWEDAFLRAMTILVGASPCALAISTPAAILSGIAQAARNGVLIKGGVYLENMGTLRAVAFDKTGTLTKGEPVVKDIVCFARQDENQVLQLAASLESRTSHPIGDAIIALAEQRNIALLDTRDAETIIGKGVEAIIDSSRVKVGGTRFFSQKDQISTEVEEHVKRMEQTGHSVVLIKLQDEMVGLIALADSPRKNARSALKALNNTGIKQTIMLTGDNKYVAANIAAQLGIGEVESGLMPEGKLDAIKQLMTKYKSVAMVGDGINDAPAMANATIGITLGGAGTDVALETADVALMADDLDKLSFAIGLSRKTRFIIYQNFVVALGVIVLLTSFAVLGLANIGVAILLHEGSTIVVVLNALRLLRYK